MLNWIISFFLLAIIAAVLGFSGMSGTFAAIAQFLTGLFVIMFVMSLIYSLISGREINPL